jgi:branched-chain amino acid transport system substrate-binding protein
VLLGVSRSRFAAAFDQLLWLVFLGSGFLLLLAAEVALVDGLIDRLSRFHLALITRAFDVLWWAVPAFFIVRAAEVFVWRPIERRADQIIPNIVRRFFAFVVYTLCFFGIVAFVYDQKITSLLATSGVIAMIVGLAIQINISNIFSGIALNLERPFKVGDWVKIGDFEECKVVDMTWRTTRLAKRDNTILNVPNSIAAESEVINFHRPDDAYELWIYFHVDPSSDPERVIKIALDAMASLECVLKEPAPGCRFIGYTEWSAEFVAVPVLRNYAKRNVDRGAIMTHLWAELHRAGLRQAIRLHEVHMLRGLKARGERSTDLLEILNGVDIFNALDDGARAHIAAQMRSQAFEPGQSVVTQGEEGDSLFIIVEGVVGVWVEVGDGKTIEVDRMGAGTFFGEMALLTGEPRTATIKAVTDTVLFEITKSDVAPLIEARPEMSEILSRELTRRALNREMKKRQYEATKEEEQALYQKIFAKIQAFFGGG